ncbi:MAG: Ig-like domain-containing protein [Muribaculaceae bacterium]|nr:Ig-like domain-containing protein [Muribaculaceae bacterium]
MNKFYKSLAAVAVCALSALCGWAYDFEEGGLYYNISGTDVSLTTGDNAYSGEIVIPATVEHDGVTYNVTTVGSVFQNNTAVTSLKLPTSVTSLPESCFAGMTGLLELEIPNVETLPNYLCDGCSALTTLKLGEGVHFASCHMTRSCTSLNKVYMLYEDVVGWNSPSGGIGGSTIPAQYKPIANNIQAQSTLYIPYGTTDAYKAKINTGYGKVTLWNKFGSYVELDPPGGGVDVESITITPANPVLAAENGATVQLTATILPEDATDKSIVWSTSDASVATVSNTGLVTRTAPLTNTGDQPYTVTITANGANDVSASVTITAEVLADIAVTSVTIEPANPTLEAQEGATVQLTATVLPENALDKTITWSTSDATVATVDANGLVTRVAGLYNTNDEPYTVDITATSSNGLTSTVTVTATVLETINPTGVTIEPANPVLAAEDGATVQLTATVLPENATYKTVTWTSANENVATVDANGLVTRVAGLFNENDQPYTVDITATTANGLTQTVTVTADVIVTVLPTALSITPAEPVLTAEASSTVQLTAVFDPETTNVRTVTWSSADETIATVDENGLVTRTAPLTNEQEQPYTVVITATTPNGLSANVTVTANIKGDDFFFEDGLYYNVLSHDDLTVEVTNSIGGTAADITCYSGDIVIPATVTHKNRTYNVIQIGDYAFGAGGSGFSAGTSVTSLTLPEGLQSIASYGVRGMGGITELVLPSTVTELGAFVLGRLSAETIVIPNAHVIGMSAMSGCTNLKHLVLGEGVQMLNNNMLNNVTSVEDVTCYATTPPTWDGTVAQFAPFNGFINSAKLYVPEGCANTYYNTSSGGIYYWRFSTIEEISNVTEITLADALGTCVDEEVLISDELLIADVEEDGTAILTDNNGSWIATNFDAAACEALGYAKSVKGIRGTIANYDTNPVITLTRTPQAGESNEEVIPETIDMTQLIANLPGNCVARVAGYYYNGELRAYSNIEDPGQRLTIDNSFIGEALENDNFINKKVVLTAIVRLKAAWETPVVDDPQDPNGTPRRVVAGDPNSSSNYIIAPVGGSVSEDIVTAVTDLNAATVQGVTYVNAAGMTSDKPFDGLNIVVTRHSDGTVTTTKIVK